MEMMPDMHNSIVPKLGNDADGTERPCLTEGRKQEIRAESRKKLDFVQAEYWKCRNGKQGYIRCPFCSPVKQNLKRRNYIGSKGFCCHTFAKAFKAILERQAEVDKAAKQAQIATLERMVNGDNSRNA